MPELIYSTWARVRGVTKKAVDERASELTCFEAYAINNNNFYYKAGFLRWESQTPRCR